MGGRGQKSGLGNEGMGNLLDEDENQRHIAPPAGGRDNLMSKEEVYARFLSDGENTYDDDTISLQDALGDRITSLASYDNAGDSAANSNPRYSQAAEYQMNCQRCVAAFEARMRGYDVQALPTYAGDPYPVNDNFLDFWEGGKADTIKISSRDSVQNVVNQMNEWGVGSRAVLGYGYKGSNSGHVVIAEQTMFGVRFLDAQTGEPIKGVRNLFSIMKKDTIELTRVDNKNFSDEAKHAFISNKYFDEPTGDFIPKKYWEE